MPSTNTLIISNLTPSQLDDPQFINDLQSLVMKSIEDSNHFVQFIVLKGLRRIVLIFGDKIAAEKVSVLLKGLIKVQFKDNASQVESKENAIARSNGDKHNNKSINNVFKVSFSLTNHTTEIHDNYLKLPSNSRMFLISPPASPPPGFNYDQEEEEPNKSQIYTPEEIRASMIKYNKELEELIKKDKESRNPEDEDDSDDEQSWHEKEIVLNDNHGVSDAPKIILHPIKGHNDHLISHAIESFRTSLPVKSIFDELSDNEGDYEDDDDEYD